MNLVQEVLEKYYQNFYVGGFEVVTLSLYLAVLAREGEKRNFYPLRLFVAVLCQIVVCIPLSILRTDHDRLLTRVAFDSAILLFFFCAVLFLHKGKINKLLLVFSSTVVSKNFSGTVIPLLRNIFGRSDLDSISFFSEFVPARDWTIYYAVQLIFLLAVAVLFSRTDRNRDVSIDLPGAVLLAVSAFVIRGIVHPVTRFYQPMSFELSVCVKILMLVIYSLIISIRAGLLSKKKIQMELIMTEELLKQEQKRYIEMRDSIEVINMKCHDIKHQLSKFQERLTGDEIHALEEAIKIYDSNIDTGNKIVDTVLYQKLLYCEKHKIKLQWMTNGGILSFITPSELYSLLSNALDNGIEAVMGLEPQKRIISLNIFREGKTTVIETTNYFNPSREPVSGTTKVDKRHHGYGMKSMRHIVKGYGGTIWTDVEDEIFILTITFHQDSKEKSL